MNTATLHETTAIAGAVAVALEVADPTRNLILVPLSRLLPRRSKRNARTTPRLSIPELAASISRLGLLQNLIVIVAPDGEHYEVVAGDRRLTALKLLAKRKRIAADHEVPCLLVADASARTVSLAENLLREQMHPADQFEAFAALVKEGRPIEDIAADFGVTPLVVQRRLKLANVSRRLLADYRADAVTLEQLMALSITDDHAAQEAAFYDSPQWQRSPHALRDHLTREEIDAGGDPVARFVGLDAYAQAGGGVRRDLFADEHSGVFLADAALLDTLARDKLAAVADEVRAEGWGWVDVAPRATYADLHRFQRVRAARREPGKAEAKRIAKLEAEQAKLQERLDDDNEAISDDEAQALQDAMDVIGNDLDAIERKLLVYPVGVVPMAGAVVSLDSEGAVVVHRGLLREDEAKALRAQQRGAEAPQAEDDARDVDAQERREDEPPALTISEKLARRLSAHRTAALQAEVARHPHVALVAVVHRLAQRIVLDGYHGSPLNISADPQDRLEQHAPDVAEAPAAVGMRKVREAWGQRLPEDSEALFAELLAMPQSELLSLLAVCVGFTVSAITSREGDRPAALLAQAVGLDMGQWWTPTAAGYFEHVSKAKALEAVQVFAPGEVHRLAKLKKAQIAAEAERLAAGSGWLPAMFRASEAVTEAAATQDEAQEPADVADEESAEEAQALAEAV
ncbi:MULTISPECIES: ParB/RepB/Spo0J family partition protein [unclassified Variovorax]|uniref:ParB/RepB/Spo0J family partition protein n=1 Tax=unclassified Variovorax TaxID=663243 RepID=UPI0008D4F5EE|nr:MULTISPECIES: ParB/RepB/Spo0J family partition protein [unclassified Variovorax]SEJ49981.1 chromosome partitioning protein, ParB family [Variovorax sp. OK202]SFC51835.1 ParB family protein [Variovorax sp. OK212]